MMGGSVVTYAQKQLGALREKNSLLCAIAPFPLVPMNNHEIRLKSAEFCQMEELGARKVVVAIALSVAAAHKTPSVRAQKICLFFLSL